MNETIQEINVKDSMIEADPLESELRTLDWIFYESVRPKEVSLANLSYMP